QTDRNLVVMGQLVFLIYELSVGQFNLDPSLFQVMFFLSSFKLTCRLLRTRLLNSYNLTRFKKLTFSLWLVFFCS
ncbi:hypothetical protein L9F63_007623, partial [Diploptera punctata]